MINQSRLYFVIETNKHNVSIHLERISHMDLQDRKVSVARLSVLSNTALVAMKIAVGLMIGSVSIMSEAIHSGVDLLASLITTFSVSKSSMPADVEHPFGHGKVENISGTIEALLIFLAAVWIIYEAIKKLLNPEPIEYVSWGVGVMLISALVNIVVSKMLFKVARETDSIALAGRRLASAHRCIHLCRCDGKPCPDLDGSPYFACHQSLLAGPCRCDRGRVVDYGRCLQTDSAIGAGSDGCETSRRRGDLDPPADNDTQACYTRLSSIAHTQGGKLPLR